MPLAAAAALGTVPGQTVTDHELVKEGVATIELSFRSDSERDSILKELLGSSTQIEKIGKRIR